MRHVLGPTCGLPRWALALTRPSCSTTASPPLTSVSAAKIAVASYHSLYDDFYWYTHFSDTNFVYGRALSQTVGTAVMRMADAQLLPYDYKASRRPSVSTLRSSTRWPSTRQTLFSS